MGVAYNTKLLLKLNWDTTDYYWHSTSNIGSTPVAWEWINGCQNFDGNDYINVPDSADFDWSAFVLKFRLKKSATWNQYYIDRRYTSWAWDGWFIQQQAWNNFRFAVYRASVLYFLSSDTTYTTLNKWIEVACKYDWSNMTMFIDWIKQSWSTAVTGAIVSSRVINVGRAWDWTAFVNGKLDQVKLIISNLWDAQIINGFLFNNAII